MAVGLDDIKKLRTLTGAGLGDCKKALAEADGNIEAAVEIIRKKGQAVAAKRSDREASEGAVLCKAENGFGAIIALKFELEMTLALSHLAGFNIDDQRERKIDFLLVCTSLEEAYDYDKEPSLKDIIDLAMSEFSTRELSKTLAKTLARVIVMMSCKRLTRYIPLVGIVIGASVNKVLSARTGRECWRALKHRKNANRCED